tara:strand:- start:1129 stop:2901 length:1773 start_codon:yes stop_codon:yes gene_type:complete
MCGIFLVFSKKGDPLPEERCKKASYELYNRGPDFFKFSLLRNKTLYISNTILSITGTPEKDHRIHQSTNKNYSLSYNGEIYNYLDLCKQYLPHIKAGEKITDTKVLLNLHEKLNSNSIPKLLNGMFAYVVYDNKKDDLIIANDVQGEKNLFFFENSEFLIISSTITSILKFNKIYDLDESTIKDYFTTRHFMSHKKTCFKNINLFSTGSIHRYSLNNKRMVNQKYDDPLNWISEKKYRKFEKTNENEIIDLLDYKLNQQIKLMIPKVKFGCIVSGGIDSSLQAAILSRHKEPHKNLVIDHGSKDTIMQHIDKFTPYFKKKITKIKLDKNRYKELSDECYKIIGSPLHTHDLPGRLEISKYFRKNGCKVFFSADGCDELLGGQQLYYNIFKKDFNFKINQSPYSTTIKSRYVSPSEEYNFFLDSSWHSIMDSYKFINSKKEKNIQSSLFLDYFIQSVLVGNRSNDLISCNSSVEPRNVFISKDIIKLILNLPLKYKINFKEKNINFRQKYILKKVFSKYFDKKLVFTKQGFSGFPNSLSKNYKFLLTKNIISSKINKINKKNNYYDLKNKKRDLNWKLINSENFLLNYFNK